MRCRDCQTEEATISLYDRLALCDNCRVRMIAGLLPILSRFMKEEEVDELLGRAIFGEAVRRVH